MGTYAVIGITADALGDGLVIAQLWNPSSKRIRVVEVSWGCRGDFDANFQRIIIQRSTARGATPDNTVTPDADNSLEGDVAPDSGAVLEMGDFTTEPTLATPPLETLMVAPGYAAATQPFAVLPIPLGHVIPPSTGLCWVILIGGGGSLPLQQVGVVFEE